MVVTVTITDPEGDVRAVRSAETEVYHRCWCGED